MRALAAGAYSRRSSTPPPTIPPTKCPCLRLRLSLRRTSGRSLSTRRMREADARRLEHQADAPEHGDSRRPWRAVGLVTVLLAVAAAAFSRR